MPSSQAASQLETPVHCSHCAKCHAKCLPKHEHQPMLPLCYASAGLPGTFKPFAPPTSCDRGGMPSDQRWAKGQGGSIFSSCSAQPSRSVKRESIVLQSFCRQAHRCPCTIGLMGTANWARLLPLGSHAAAQPPSHFSCCIYHTAPEASALYPQVHFEINPKPPPNCLVAPSRAKTTHLLNLCSGQQLGQCCLFKERAVKVVLTMPQLQLPCPTAAAASCCHIMLRLLGLVPSTHVASTARSCCQCHGCPCALACAALLGCWLALAVPRGWAAAGPLL